MQNRGLNRQVVIVAGAVVAILVVGAIILGAGGGAGFTGPTPTNVVVAQQPTSTPVPVKGSIQPTSVPATKVPATKVPATKAPATQAPPTKVPPTKIPATQAPATQVPATKPPATQNVSVATTAVPPTKVAINTVPPTKAPPTKAATAAATKPATTAPTKPPTAPIKATVAINVAAVGDPFLNLFVSCDLTNFTATFTIQNSGAAMQNAGSYSLNEPSVGVTTGSVSLGAGGSLVLANKVGNSNITVTYVNSVQTVNLQATGNCLKPTNTPTNTPRPTNTPTFTKTFTPTKTITPTKSDTPVPSATLVPSITLTPSITFTPSETFTPLPTKTPANTNTPRPTKTPTGTATDTLVPSETPVPSITLTPSITFTPSQTFTPLPTKTPSNTNTPRPTKTATPTKTITLTPSITFTPSQTFTATATLVPPNLLLGVSCNDDQTANFTIQNTGGPLTGGTYGIKNPVTGQTTTNGLTLAAGGTLNLNNQLGYSIVNIHYSDSNGVQINLSVSGSCALIPTNTPTNTPVPPTDTPTATHTPVTPTVTNTNTPVPPTATNTITPVPPVLVGSLTCAEGLVALTIQNNGGDMLSAQPFTVTSDGLKTTILSGSIQLKAGTSYQTQSRSFDITTLGTLTLSVSGGATPQTLSTTVCIKPTATNTNTPVPPTATNTNTPVPPVLVGSMTCANGAVALTIQNNGGDMLGAQPFTVTSDSVSTTILSGSVQLKAGASYQTQTSAFDITTLGNLTLIVTDGKTPQTLGTAVCMKPPTATNTPVPPTATNTNTPVPPALVASLTCANGAVSLTIKNNGGDMLSAQPFTVSSDGLKTTILSGSIQLKAGESYQTQTTAFDITKLGNVTISVTSGETPQAIGTTLCAKPNAPTNTPPATLTKTAVPTGSVTPAPTATKVPATNVPATPVPTATKPSTKVPPAVWQPIKVGPAVCEQWLIYHTNQFQTDANKNFEIMRLGDIPGKGSTPDDLSQTPGKNVLNAGPSLSADRAWVAFASTRDGDWNIYVAPTDGNSGVRRKTTATQSGELDIAPAWSPDGLNIAYVANISNGATGGNWNIFLFNVQTGVTTQLTDTPAINFEPYWSPDSKKLVFESNLSGHYDLYEYDLAAKQTTQITSLKDADAFNAAYSPDGKHISYRVYNAAKPNLAVLMLSDSNGKNAKPLSDPSATATNQSWSHDGDLIAFQSDLHGQNDIFVYQISTGKTRLLTDSADKINHFAPTWYCNSSVVIFTSEAKGNPNVFSADALPMDAAPINVAKQATQLTNVTKPGAADEYAENQPPQAEESSRINILPSATKK